MIIYPHLKNRQPIKCSICHLMIPEHSKIHQVNYFYGIICEGCYEKFEKEDSEMIVGLLVAYGGHFGKRKRQDFSMDGIMEEIIEDCEKMKGKLDTTEINALFLHKALLYGITPQDFTRMMEQYL